MKPRRLKAALGVTLLSASALAGCLLVDSFGDFTTDAGPQDGMTGDASTDRGGDQTTDAAFERSGDTGNDSSCMKNLTDDPRNCGACGHSCLGAPCVESHCQPEVLIHHLAEPLGVAVGSGGVYVLENVADASLWVWQDGASAEFARNEKFPRDFVIPDGGTRLYWSSQDGVRSCPLPTVTSGVCTPEPLGPVNNDAYQIAANEQGVIFWTNKPHGQIWQASPDGGEAGVIASGLEQPVGLYVTGGSSLVYFTTLGSPDASTNDGGTIGRVAADGSGLQTLIVGQDQPLRVGFTSPTTLIWTNHARGGAIGSISTCEFATGQCQLSTLTECDSIIGVQGLAVSHDQAYVTWNVKNGGIVSVSLPDGGSCTEMLTKEIVLDRPYPAEIAEDSNYLYWSEGELDGSLVRVAK